MRRPDGTIRKTRRCYNEPGHAHALTFSCYQRLQLLNRDRTRLWMVQALELARRRWELELWAYVIMPEHVHVLVYPMLYEYDISKILHGIKMSVARRAIRFLRAQKSPLLKRLEVTSPSGRTEDQFWEQGGGYDRNIYQDKVAVATIDYFHENPVRRGLVEADTDWRWSSARFYAGLDDVVLQMDRPALYP